MLLDFFGLGVEAESEEKVSGNNCSLEESRSVGPKHINDSVSAFETEVEIRSLSIVLNKPNYRFCKANITNFSSHYVRKKDSVSVTGKLGNMSIIDLSPHGQLYPEKFFSSGDEILDFQIFWFDKVDPELSRSYDMRMKLRMASVVYTHSQRFLMEFQAYFQDFSRLRCLFNTIRSVAATKQVVVGINRSSRVLLDVRVDSPVILIPMSHNVGDLIILDLQHLIVQNSFRQAGSAQTIAGKKLRDREFEVSDHLDCLLDVLDVSVVNLDVHEGTITDRKDHLFSINSPSKGESRYPIVLRASAVASSGVSLLQEKCSFKLQVERNLESAVCLGVPGLAILVELSKIHFMVNPDQYTLIKGILAYNFGEPIDDLELFDNNPPEGGQKLSIDVVNTAIELDMEDVTVDLISRNVRFPESPSVLGRILFTRSNLIYERLNNDIREIDLVSKEIVLYDFRFEEAPMNKRPNIFSKVLCSHRAEPSEEKHQLQAEIHYRSTKCQSRLTVLLNNMRVFAILDWWHEMKDYITSSRPDPLKEGIVSKRAPVIPAQEYSYKFKLNVTDSEFILLEDTSISDTNAVILKCTAVITYVPSYYDKPLSCHFSNCELLSCSLSCQSETAVSIVDPVTVTVEVSRRFNNEKLLGIMEVTSNYHYCLEFALGTHLAVRLSYKDMVMFKGMLESLPRQFQQASGSSLQVKDKSQPANFQLDVIKLTSLGFSRQCCVKALENCKGNLNEAALWLTSNATPCATAGTPVNRNWIIGTSADVEVFEVRVLSLALCVIDDCQDVDVPLMEFSLNNLHFKQNLTPSYQGVASLQFNTDYYNRRFSGWEPFIETYRCKLSWSYIGDIKVCVEAEDCLDVNITSALLDLYRTVKMNWTEDYINWVSSSPQGGGDTRVSDIKYKKRTPFVPYAIKNETGCFLYFETSTTTPTSPCQEATRKSLKSDCQCVGPGETVEFTFTEKTFSRQANTHELRIHQLRVEIDGWHSTNPVSVDKVGTYFRRAKPNKSGTTTMASGVTPARIVFDVSLEGSARKMITVRSALLIVNKLDETIEVKLVNRTMLAGGTKLMVLSPGMTLAVPLDYINADILVRPLIKSSPAYHYCNPPIYWKEVTKVGDFVSDLKVCQPVSQDTGPPFRLCILKERNNYPMDNIPLTSSTTHASVTPYYWTQPAHTITLLSPVTVVNLLPSDLHFQVGTEMEVRVKPGKQCNLTNIDTMVKTGFKFKIENFNQKGELFVSRDTCCEKVTIKLHDITGRKLELYVQLLLKKGGNVKVVLTSPFWIINKTGLPLVVRQEGNSDESAGQFEENEIARSVVPLMFGPPDSENCGVVIRIGKRLHPDSAPQWCKKFHLHKGAYVRQLKVLQSQKRPPLVYNVGIDIKKGVGRYRDCGMITLWPRFQIENRTEFKIEVAQKYFTVERDESNVRNPILSVLPKSFTPFHWPRIDQDQIICVRIQNIPGCMWSGGFNPENINSFHINVRYNGSKNQFLRVDISLCSSTFHIAIMDAYTMPPPFRIDNLSEVPITYYQTDIVDKNLRSIVRPHVSVPYAWDDPLLPPNLTLEAPGGSSSNYKLDSCGEGENLTYESFIYIILAETFPECDTGIGASILTSDKYLELVLDVSPGGTLVFNRKEPGRRSQLWCMTSEGFLQHEGSCPPSDSKRPSQKQAKNAVVLDVSNSGISSSGYCRLELRKQDSSRRATQTWKFGDDGRLTCQNRNVFVQAKDGHLGLRSDIEAVLGPFYETEDEEERKHFFAAYCISRQKCRPGSGFLTVWVIMDGPTRVLQIKDKRNLRASYRTAGGEDPSRPVSNWEVMSEERSIKVMEGKRLISTPLRAGGSERMNFQLQFRLTGGIGVSLVNSFCPEELMYARFSNINVEVIHDQQRLSLNGSVEKFQIDNQILNAKSGNVLYITPSPKSDLARHLPALNFKVVKQHSMYSNADIYRHFFLMVKNITLIIEEELLLKLFLFWGWVQSDLEMERQESLGGDTNYALQTLTANYAKRYYFGDLRLDLEQVRLSVLTKSHLTPDLLAVKRQIGLTLIQFEDAQIDLDSFVRIHPFETADFLLASIMKHYRDKLLSQAHKILTASDILGNPLGFITDLMEGFSGLISDGDVGYLVKNVTHGMANSALKVTVSLSDVMGRATLDERHELERLRIRSYHSRGFGDYFMAGIKGLKLGVMGGLTSMVQQPLSGASSDGLQGFIVGLGRGLVGTVTKPAVGVLDLAAGMASAVRDTSRGSTHFSPGRSRPTRVVIGPGGLLPKYSHADAVGQEFLYNIPNRTAQEIFIAREQLSKANDNLRALISSEKVRILKSSSSSQNPTVLEVDYNDLEKCSYVIEKNRYLLELTHDSNPRSLGKKPMVICDCETTAKRVVRLIQYAKNLHDELLHTLKENGVDQEDD